MSGQNNGIRTDLVLALWQIKWLQLGESSVLKGSSVSPQFNSQVISELARLADSLLVWPVTNKIDVTQFSERVVCPEKFSNGSLFLPS